MNIQWYPGHMTKAKRAMKEDLKLIDLIIELVDARAPLASRNPDIDELGKGKARVIVLNKSDLADERYNDAWASWFTAQGYHVIRANSRTGAGVRQVMSAVQEACREKIERDRKRGIKNRPIRAMVAGIPNVGKSTFINSFVGKASAKTGNKPGVTRGNQWIRMNASLELLDTPGILWPKFEDPQAGLFLAMIGSIHDEILNRSELAVELLALLIRSYPAALRERYQMEEQQDLSWVASSVCDNKSAATALLSHIARIRGCLMKGGEPDDMRAALLVIDDFRSGRLGRITLECPAGFADGRREGS
ncbi:MAG: ribosome biogenesis GTPase YlqF [Clostridiales bacterium]|nr:ribosome biogenesis GTPase YlqF [Clostridiales bacterium]